MNHRFNRRGFSLLELSVALLLVGLVAGIALKINPTLGGSTNCYTKTQAQLADIQDALERFAIQNKRFPVPASRTVDSTNQNFGREAVTQDDPAYSTKLSTLLKVVADPTDSSKKAVIGALPFQALSLTSDYAGDCWGNKFTYAASVGLTTVDDFKNNDGVLKIERPDAAGGTSVFLTNAAYAVISHGADGLGAVKVNYANANSQGWCDQRIEQQAGGVGSANDDRSEHTSTIRPFLHTDIQAGNCNFQGVKIVAAPLNDGKKTTTANYDDLVIFKAKQKSFDCTLDGKTILDGSKITAFVNNTAASAAACNSATNSKELTCAKGVLGDATTANFKYTTCTPNNGHDCPGLFGGSAVAEGSTIAAFKLPTATDTAACNAAANKETRTCTAGVWTGTFTNSSCKPDGDCTTPWGTAVVNGDNVKAYFSEKSADCSAADASESRKCTNNKLSGSATFETCSALPVCTTPWGDLVADGASVPSYSTSSATDCNSVKKMMQCNHGKLSTGFPYATCTNPDNCTTDWGSIVLDGHQVDGYSTNSSADCASAKQALKCNKGSLPDKDTYKYETCTPPQKCPSPWAGGPDIADRATVDAYKIDQSADCASEKETLTCDSGALTGGSATFENCTPLSTRSWHVVGGGPSGVPNCPTGFAEGVACDNWYSSHSGTNAEWCILPPASAGVWGYCGTSTPTGSGACDYSDPSTKFKCTAGTSVSVDSNSWKCQGTSSTAKCAILTIPANAAIFDSAAASYSLDPSGNVKDTNGNPVAQSTYTAGHPITAGNSFTDKYVNSTTKTYKTVTATVSDTGTWTNISVVDGGGAAAVGCPAMDMCLHAYNVSAPGYASPKDFSCTSSVPARATDGNLTVSTPSCSSFLASESYRCSGGTWSLQGVATAPGVNMPLQGHMETPGACGASSGSSSASSGSSSSSSSGSTCPAATYCLKTSSGNCTINTTAGGPYTYYGCGGNINSVQLNCGAGNWGPGSVGFNSFATVTGWTAGSCSGSGSSSSSTCPARSGNRNMNNCSGEDGLPVGNEGQTASTQKAQRGGGAICFATQNDYQCSSGTWVLVNTSSGNPGTWTLGSYGACTNGTQTASYSCVGGNGTCTGSKPADESQSCGGCPSTTQVVGECGSMLNLAPTPRNTTLTLSQSCIGGGPFNCSTGIVAYTCPTDTYCSAGTTHETIQAKCNNNGDWDVTVTNKTYDHGECRP